MKKIVLVMFMLTSCTTWFLKSPNLDDSAFSKDRELTFLMEPTPLLDRGFSEPIYIYQGENEFLAILEKDELNNIFTQFSLDKNMGLRGFRVIIKDRTKLEVEKVLDEQYGKRYYNNSWRPLRKYRLNTEGEPVIRVFDLDDGTILINMGEEYR